MARCLRSTNASLGHVMSAYTYFVKMKSADLSPDGNLGGRGYIQKITDMRRQYTNIIEALSALSDTLYDEVRAPHWARLSRSDTEIVEVIEDAEEIKEDPEGWAREEEQEMDAKGTSKQASVVDQVIDARKILAGDPSQGKYRFVVLKNAAVGMSEGRPIYNTEIVVPNIYTASINDLGGNPQVEGRPWAGRERSLRPGLRFFTSRYADNSYHILVAFKTDGDTFSKDEVLSMYQLLGV